MTETRIQFNQIVDNQVPSYVKEEFPLILEFLSQYYLSQEFKGAPIDLIQNIDRYTKLDENANVLDNPKLGSDVDEFEDTITLLFDPTVPESYTGTKDFPNSYGLLKIGNEIITYTGKTHNSFTGCIRGFSGIESYNKQASTDELVFSSSNAETHSKGDEIVNISNLFLKEFLKKTKYQLLPGFEDRQLYSNLDESLFIKQAKDFYSIRGTDESFKILFKVLYGKDATVIRPKDYLFRASDSEYRITNDLVVEPLEGDPLKLKYCYLTQDAYGDIIPEGRGPVADVKKLTSDYYQVSIDAGYNRDILDNGSIYGRFSVHPKTKCVGNVSIGSSILDVDSTVGFPNSGEIYVTFNDDSTGIVSYTSKSINQFFGCSNITKPILDKTYVGVNTYVYGKTFDDEIIKVRITSVLESLDIVDDTYGLSENNIINIKTLGVNPEDKKSNDWFFNNPTTYETSTLRILNIRTFTYEVVTKKEHSIRIGDQVLFVSNDGIESLGNVESTNSSTSFTTSGQGSLNIDQSYIVKRIVKKGTSNTHSEILKYNTDVQNVYKIKDDTLIASSSIPYYYGQSLEPENNSIIFDGDFLGDTFTITTNTDHGFYTGDLVYYTPEKQTQTTLNPDTGLSTTTTSILSSLFGEDSEGLYYVRRVDQYSIKLSKSKSNLYEDTVSSDPDVSSYMVIETLTRVQNNKIQKYEFAGKVLEHQKLFREIKEAENDGYHYQTDPGSRTGILVNGVEILNYKSKDFISYGSIKEIEVLSGGSNYDIINPPIVEITDKNGTGAVAHCAVTGSLQEIRIIDPGFDYVDNPTITISGGNGFGAKAQASLSLVDHTAFFYADAISGQVSLASSTIGFSTYHKFRNGESVIYKTDGQPAIGGLGTDSTYYVSVKDFSTIKLHKTQEDAVLGINTIGLSSYGQNKQYFESVNKKSVISSINITNSGSRYQNKKRVVGSVGINTYSNTIEIKNHGYESGEVVRYIGVQSNADASIGGITTNTDYYLTKIDSDTFKLSQVGSEPNQSTFFYDTKQFVQFTSSGNGTQIFNYPPITVEVNGNIGIASTSDSSFKAVVQPIFRGEVTSVCIENGGSEYGSDVINFERSPTITLTDGRNAQFTAIISNGSIVEVLVDNVGIDYLAPPTLSIVSQTGTDAILTPILQNGSITKVKIVNGGTGYVQGETLIVCTTPGKGVEFRPILDRWNINLFYKKIQNITSDDGVLAESLNYGLQYTHIYAPRRLRESLYQIDAKGNKIYGKPDLIKSIGTNIETDSTNHSPIIGWAYDGNPIYGPYGYLKRSGGSQVVRMKSSYVVEASLKENRPSLSTFPEGFFVEDYTFYQNSDESYLDENNGRFCVTPDFPNGTYAYFSTINDSSESTGNFSNYRKPAFPYLIGKSFKSRPNVFNFAKSSNQDDYDLTKSNWKRNTSHYNLIDGNSSYQYINIPNKLKQKSIITSVNSGNIENIDIIFGGDDYKVNESLVFDEENTSGQNANASISRINGKTVENVSFASSIINDVEIYPGNILGEYRIVCSTPHQFNNFDSVYLTGFNTTSAYLNGYYNIGISTLQYSVQAGISTATTTGLVTNFYISGDLSSLKDNDIVSISSSEGTEEVKVLNVYPKDSKIRVLRSINGIGVSHFSSDIATKKNRDFTINSGFKTSYDYKVNKQIYFNPVESVGLGTTAGVGISSSLFFDSIEDLSPIGIGTSVKSIIYFRNAKDYFKYNSGGYVDIVNSTSSSFNIEKRKIVAIGDTTITLDFNTSSLSGAGVTAYLNRRNFVNIPTKTIYIPNHGLETGDSVVYSSNGGSAVAVSTTGVGSTSLAEGQTLYVAKITDSLIGIATVKVGIGSTGVISGVTSSTKSTSTLYLVGLGTNVYHSFATTYPILKGSVSKTKAIVSTAQTHGLKYGDNVYISVNPSISTSFTVKYNDTNRRLVINPRSFTGVNTTSNGISIAEHNWTNGQKVIHTSSSLSGGLVNNKIYYVRVVDNDTVSLTTSFYQSQQPLPDIVDITSSGTGTLSPVNPPIPLYKDSIVTFDLSDPSLAYTSLGQDYSAFDFKLFIDKNETNIFESSDVDASFNVSRTGRVGIDTTAKLVLTVNENLPENLYYNLKPSYKNGISLPDSKSEIVKDDEIFSNNNLQIKESLYNGSYKIIKSTSNTFEYQINAKPERSSYISSESIISYETDSIYASSSSISKIKIFNKGNGYLKYPSADVGVGTGSGAEFNIISTSIGKISKTKIQDIGFDFPSDTTLSPSALVPQLAKIETLSSLESIGITSFGRGYTTTPNLLLFDGKTNELVSDIDIRYNIGDSQVTILKNSYSLYNQTPTILPINNSNGIGINSVGFNTTTKDVTITLSVGFSTADSFPFNINDKVLVENIGIVGFDTCGIGIGTTSKNYNSANYNYNLFTITSVNTNIGGIGNITYNMSEFLSEGESPGTFDPNTSSGRVIPQKYFPQFNVVLTKGNYIKGETVVSDSSSGIVEDWDVKTNILTISSNKYFKEGERIDGLTSKVSGISSSVTYFDSFYKTSAKSEVINGSRLNTGYLNTNNQVLQDGNYYQNFSYSIRSGVDLETWNDVVGVLNHTSGYKRFSDFIIESNLPESDTQDLVIKSNSSDIQITTDLVSVVDLNCYPSFDMVGENSINLQSGLLSNQVTFGGRILSDYQESVGNRVLSIDNISEEFNSNPRSTNYSEVDRFSLSDSRIKKYVTFVRDRRYTSQRQTMLVTLLQANSTAYLNQYARVETVYDLGSFDFAIEGSDGLLLYYPTKYNINDYDVTILSYGLNDNISGTGSTTLGSSALIETDSTLISGSTTIVGISTAYRSAKILVEIDSDGSTYEFDEINLIHDGTSVEFLEYGQLTTHTLVGAESSSGLGTYHPYISGSTLKVDFIPNVGSGTTINVNCMYVALADSNSTGVGTISLNHSLIECRSTTIPSSGSPTAVGIASYKSIKTTPAVSLIDPVYQGVYAVVQVTDKTNNRYQLSEIVVSDLDSSTTTITEFATLDTNGSLGTIDANVSGEYTNITFTPLPSIDVEVKIYLNAMRYEQSDWDEIDFTNGNIESGYGYYTGTESDIRRQFNLSHDNYNIFERSIDPTDSLTFNILENTIKIPNHFFVTGEKVSYDNGGTNSSYSIGIATTSITGYGTTDKLPDSVYIVKIDSNTVKLAGSAENALKSIPEILNLESVGIGTLHTFTSTNQNAKVLVSIDNIIQSPIVSTAITSRLSLPLAISDDIAYFTGITSFFGGDLIEIDSEIMKIEGVGIGSTNSIRLRRPWLGTTIVGHASDAIVTKVVGNYNIVDNYLNFSEAPYGNIPESLSTNPPDERDWVGISTGSSFNGRVFLRSGITNTTEETYSKNYVFSDISNSFTGINSSFILKSNGSNVSGIVSQSIILVNDIYQKYGQKYDYTLGESSGITTISFVGTARTITSDVGISSFPKGGIIVSIGSTEGLGYQPLVAAGGTAIVSIAGTIQSISIGNSGSGYRSGIQTYVRVGVQTHPTSIQYVGFASISNGRIVSVAITNPGSGYTTTNPPKVIFDSPLSYSNIPLKYSSSSSGIGTGATIDIVVGQGSSVIDFEIRNTGYAYGNNQILTVSIGGTIGIPTTSSFKEFQVTIDRVSNDKFSGWSIGELQTLDSIEDQFNGSKKDFLLKVNQNIISILSSPGSGINIQDNLLVFVNNILQVPGEGYIFTGGSVITFTEAPKSGDSASIVFYKGNGDNDVIDRDVLETVKVGDELIIGYDSSLGQSEFLQEESRTVTRIDSVNLVETNPYFGPGNTGDVTLRRPVVWCKQTEDKIIDGQIIGKDRDLYESSITPSAYIISSVGIGSTIIYVDNVRPFFNPQNENDVNVDFQRSIILISQDIITSAAATAVVSSAGTISSITISDGGVGYSTNPSVSIASTVGIAITSSRAQAIATISSGSVTAIAVTSPGFGYTTSNPPSVLIESPNIVKEQNSVVSYSGDSGIIVGFGTTTTGSNKLLIFDLFIPTNSYLRNSTFVGAFTTTISEITTGDYFVVNSSNVSVSNTSFISLSTSGSQIGIGTTFADSVYQVNSYQTVSRNVSGIGVTNVRRVFVKVSGITTGSYAGSISTSTYFGDYSWGKIQLESRSAENQFNFYGNDGFSGINTSAIVVRSTPLKYKNYSA